jgi:transposase
MIGAIALDVFSAFVKCEWLPNLKRGDIVFMDNLSAHKNPKIVNAIESVGATVKFLPPYSPDRNPIETLWSKVKEFVRRQATSSLESLDDAAGMGRISKSDLLGWFHHCGYGLTET